MVVAGADGDGGVAAGLVTPCGMEPDVGAVAPFAGAALLPAAAAGLLGAAEGCDVAPAACAKEGVAVGPTSMPIRPINTRSKPIRGLIRIAFIIAVAPTRTTSLPALTGSH